jgi:hypothetical protein
MNEIVPAGEPVPVVAVQGGRLQVATSATQPSKALVAVLDSRRNRVVDGHLRPPVVPSPGVMAEARRLLAEWDRHARPPTALRIDTWLVELSAGTAGGVGADLEARRRAICIACSEFPATVFNRKTSILALQTFRFFPTAADVCQLLKPFVDEFETTYRAIKALVAGAGAGAQTASKQNSAPPERLTPEARQEAALRANLRIAELRAIGMETARAFSGGPATPSHLSKLEIARAATPEMLAMRPDLRAVLAAVGESEAHPNAAGNTGFGQDSEKLIE